MTGRKLGVRRNSRRDGSGVLLVAALAILGGFIGLIASASMASGRSLSWGGLVELITGPSASAHFAAILGGWAFVSAGAMLGGNLGILVWRLAHPGLVCPGAERATRQRQARAERAISSCVER